ncbi:hypothetical protein PVAND_005117 [Polypedilum vanderplanki]|uniref:ER-bound oxygenase mpaB/mpaB'/Rubber oxygenase catalytic domain-containing protein n=1 Tax=Polypedilum vanderplanki TaxID=319348 RepID=A0A9J6BYY4_POLVA|nr:hypothetical protein PVAND_005117 [Polypedilum vanderplanki]
MNPIVKNENYSKLLNNEGFETSVNEEEILELPSWVDKEKIKKGQWFVSFNFGFVFRTAMIAIIAAPISKPLMKIMKFTKQSSSPKVAYRRFTLNFMHAFYWFLFKIEPGSKAWKSFEVIRSIHNHINKRLTKADERKISQTDMVVTQFLFIGFQILYQNEIGIYGKDEELEAYNHVLRLVGYMLGIEDKFNVCGETVEETRARCWAIVEDIYKPFLINPSEEYLNYIEPAVEGMWHSVPFMHFNSILFFLKRFSNVPNFQCIKLKHDSCTEFCAFEKISIYTKIRIKLDMFFVEYLSKFFIYRIILNFFYTFVIATLIFIFPILSMIKFGWKFAYVKMSNKKE